MNDTLVAWLAGLGGPLLAVVATWIAVSRAHRRNPAGVHSVMLTAFAVKMVFFAAYAVVMVKGLGLDVSVFGISFAIFFISLYAIEAVLFARLFRAPVQGAR
ncbi:MAG TPA: hypothetical protein VFV78_04385 [Vicinamibacterales bacterium]|nr:hypothetical protein [Vicinamibacterales bacterium]